MEENVQPKLTITFAGIGAAIFTIEYEPDNSIYPEQILAVAGKLEFMGKQALQEQRIQQMMEDQKQAEKTRIVTPGAKFVRPE